MENTNTDHTVRELRDERLAKEFDPVRCNPLRWDNLTNDQLDEWLNFRQLLLDIPEQDGFPENVVWPVKPEE